MFSAKDSRKVISEPSVTYLDPPASIRRIRRLPNPIIHPQVRFPHALVMTLLFKRDATLAQQAKLIWQATSTHSINLGTYVFLFKSLLCLMRHVRGVESPLNVLVAGALAGYRVFGKNDAINSQINMYILSRVILGTVNALVRLMVCYA